MAIYSNRFAKHYKQNHKKINTKRKLQYKKKKKKGICTRCKRKALKNITLCSYHKKKQQLYNSRR